MARISYNQMAKMFHRWATGYKAGIDIRTLCKKESQFGSPAYRIKAGQVFDVVDSGDTLANAMTNTDGYFPDLAISVVHAGEKGGRLDEAFKRLSHHYKSLVDFRNRFLSSIAWPCFELAASVGVVALLIVVLGWIGDSSPDGAIDIFGLGLGTSGNLTLFLGGVALFLGALFILVFGTLKGWFGRLPMKIARRIPLVGKTIECLALSRFSWTMSVAESAGMNPVEIGRLSLRATENFYYTELEDEVCDSFQLGEGYYKTLEATDAFPEEFLMYIENGETAGELSESMHRISDMLRQKAEDNLATISKIGFFLVFLFVAVLIGGTVIMLYKQYLDQLNSYM